MQIKIQSLQSDEEVAKLKAEIFEIYEQQNKAHEITPEVYLNKKLEHLNTQASLQKLKSQLKVENLELYKFASYNLPNLQIFYTPDETCIMIRK